MNGIIPTVTTGIGGTSVIGQGVVSREVEEIKRKLDEHIKKEIGHTIIMGRHRYEYTGSGVSKRITRYRIFTDNNETNLVYDEQRLYNAAGTVCVGYRYTYYVDGKVYKRLGTDITFDGDGDVLYWKTYDINPQ